MHEKFKLEEDAHKKLRHKYRKEKRQWEGRVGELETSVRSTTDPTTLIDDLANAQFRTCQIKHLMTLGADEVETEQMRRELVSLNEQIAANRRKLGLSNAEAETEGDDLERSMPVNQLSGIRKITSEPDLMSLSQIPNESLSNSARLDANDIELGAERYMMGLPPRRLPPGTYDYDKPSTQALLSRYVVTESGKLDGLAAVDYRLAETEAREMTAEERIDKMDLELAKKQYIKQLKKLQHKGLLVVLLLELSDLRTLFDPRQNDDKSNYAGSLEVMLDKQRKKITKLEVIFVFIQLKSSTGRARCCKD